MFSFHIHEFSNQLFQGKPIQHPFNIPFNVFVLQNLYKQCMYGVNIFFKVRKPPKTRSDGMYLPRGHKYRHGGICATKECPIKECPIKFNHRIYNLK